MNSTPFPPDLRHLENADARPLHIGCGEAARLIEYWGFSADGKQHLRKLVSAGLVKVKRPPEQRNLRYCVASLIEYYQQA